jgi:BMFP domain-containing protein YqiC
VTLNDHALFKQALKDIAELQARVEALEAKRAPGRPPKTESKEYHVND